MYRPEDAYNIASALLSFWIDHRSRAASSPRSSPQHHNPKHTLTVRLAETKDKADSSRCRTSSNSSPPRRTHRQDTGTRCPCGTTRARPRPTSRSGTTAVSSSLLSLSLPSLAMYRRICVVCVYVSSGMTAIWAQRRARARVRRTGAVSASSCCFRLPGCIGLHCRRPIMQAYSGVPMHAKDSNAARMSED